MASPSPTPATQSLDSLRQQLSRLKAKKSDLTSTLNLIKQHRNNLNLESISPPPTIDPVIKQLSKTLKNQEDLLSIYRTTSLTVFEFDENVGRRDRESFKNSLLQEDGIDLEDDQEVTAWLDGLLEKDSNGNGNGTSRKEKKGLGIGVRLEIFHRGQFYTPYYLLFSNSSSKSKFNSNPKDSNLSKAYIQSSTISDPSSSNSTSKSRKRSNENPIAKHTRLDLVRHTLPHFVSISDLVEKHFGNSFDGERKDVENEENEDETSGLDLLERLKHTRMESFLQDIHKQLSNQFSRSNQLFSLKSISENLPGLISTEFSSTNGRNEIVNDLLSLLHSGIINKPLFSSEENEIEGLDKEIFEKQNIDLEVDLETYANESFDKILIKWNLPVRSLFTLRGELDDGISKLLQESLEIEEEQEDGDGDENENFNSEISTEMKRKRKSSSSSFKRRKSIEIENREKGKIKDLLEEEKLILEFEISFDLNHDRMMIEGGGASSKNSTERIGNRRREEEEILDEEESQDEDEDEDESQDEPRPDGSEPSSSSSPSKSKSKSKSRKSKNKESEKFNSDFMDLKNKSEISIHLIRKPCPTSNIEFLLSLESQEREKNQQKKKRKRNQIKSDHQKLLEIRREESSTVERRERRMDLEEIFFEIVDEKEEKELRSREDRIENVNEDQNGERNVQRIGESRDLDLNVSKACWKIWRELKGERTKKQKKR